MPGPKAPGLGEFECTYFIFFKNFPRFLVSFASLAELYIFLGASEASPTLGYSIEISRDNVSISYVCSMSN